MRDPIGEPIRQRRARACARGNARRARTFLAFAATALAAAPAQAAGGLEIFPDLGRLVLLILLFLLLIPPAQALVFRPLLRVLDERIERMQGARKQAARIAAEAHRLAEEYAQSRAEVRAEAEAERRAHLEEAKRQQAELLRQTRSQVEAELEQARGEIRGAVEQARGSLRDEAQELGQMLAERLLGRSLVS